MRWRLFISLLAFSIGSLILGIIGWFSRETVFYAYSLGVLSVGLGVNSLVITLHTDRTTNQISMVLERIEILQKEIKKAQEEQPTSSKPLLATLQGLSQYYLDYMSNKKSEDKLGE